MACTTGIGGDRPPAINEYRDTLEFFLCRACRYLSKEQLESIVRHDQSTFCSTTNRLHEWYSKHLEEDYIYEDGHKHRPDEDMAKKEIERIKTGDGHIITKSVYPY